MTPSEKAKAIISKIIYANVASICEDSLPWNTPVYVAHDEAYHFYWASWQENQHSKNVRQNPNVFLTIYDPTLPEGEGEGVYIKAHVVELADQIEIEYALRYYDKNKAHQHAPADFLPPFPRRIYKAIPEKVWMNADGEADGNFVDTRVEVSL